MKNIKTLGRLLTLFLVIPLFSCRNNSSLPSLSSEDLLPSSSDTKTSSEQVTTSESSEMPASSESSSPTEVITYPIVNFNAVSPIDVPPNAKIKLAGSFNGWNPQAENFALSQVIGKNYTFTHEFSASDVGTRIEYKYVLYYDNQVEGMWDFVEGGPQGQEIGNRTFTLKAGINNTSDTIRSFKNNMDQTTLTRGTLKLVNLAMPQFNNKTRTIRIWLPDSYDANNTTKRYPVMYMQDGQNLFDQYTSFSGEWQIDESMGAMMDNGYGGTIVVGVDNGNDKRLDEYSPTWPFDPNANRPTINPEGEEFASFLVHTVKPYIDTNFNTLTTKEHTGIGGSSMGGIISFFTALSYQDVFGYALIFSSSFWLYTQNSIEAFLNDKIVDVNHFPKMYVYHGKGEGSYTYMAPLEALFVAHNIPQDKYLFNLINGGAHNEPSWASAFPAAYRWLVGI